MGRNTTTDSSSTPAVRRGGLAGTGGFGLTILAAIAVAAFLLGRGFGGGTAASGDPSAEASVLASALPTDDAPSPPPSEPAASNPSSPAPSGFITGELPPPDATVPPDVPGLIGGLDIVDLASAVSNRGFACESEVGSNQGMSGGYTLGCHGMDATAHAEFGLSVTYWTMDGVSEIHAFSLADASISDIDPATASPFFADIVRLAAGDEASVWLTNHIGASECSSDCTETFGAVRIHLTLGSHGAQQLDIYGYEG